MPSRVGQFTGGRNPFAPHSPVISGITGERMETEVMETLTLCSSVLQTSLPEILESVHV